MKEKEITQAIKDGSVESVQSREVLHKAISETRSDLFASTENHRGTVKDAGKAELRYANGRRCQGESELELAAKARNFTLSLMGKLTEAEAVIVSKDELIAKLQADIEGKVGEIAKMQSERDTAKNESETFKSELAKTAGELATVKAELELAQEPGGNTASGLPEETPATVNA